MPGVEVSKRCGVDDELLPLEREAPVGDRPELRAPAEQRQQQRRAAGCACRRRCRRRRGRCSALAVGSRRAARLRRRRTRSRPLARSRLEARQQWLRGHRSRRAGARAVTLPAAPRLPPRRAPPSPPPRRCRRSTTRLPALVQRSPRAPRNCLPLAPAVEAVDLAAGAAGTSRRRPATTTALAMKRCAGRSVATSKRPSSRARHRAHLLAEMKARAERRDLLAQPLDQLARRWRTGRAGMS